MRRGLGEARAAKPGLTQVILVGMLACFACLQGTHGSRLPVSQRLLPAVHRTERNFELISLRSINHHLITAFGCRGTQAMKVTSPPHLSRLPGVWVRFFRPTLAKGR